MSLNGIHALLLTFLKSLVSLTWRHPPAGIQGYVFRLRAQMCSDCLLMVSAFDVVFGHLFGPSMLETLVKASTKLRNLQHSLDSTVLF